MTESERDRRRKDLSNRMRRIFVKTRARQSRPVRRVDMDSDIVIAGMMVMIVLLGVLAAVTLYQQNRLSVQQSEVERAQKRITRNQAKIGKQQAQLERLERRDRINSYQTAYRFCTRINIDRAAIHALVDRSLRGAGTPEEQRFARRYKRKIEAKNGMPILDCEPNVDGGPAAYWPPRKQRDFVRRWDKGKLTPAEIGICKIRIGMIETRPRACLKP